MYLKFMLMVIVRQYVIKYDISHIFQFYCKYLQCPNQYCKEFALGKTKKLHSVSCHKNCFNCLAFCEKKEKQLYQQIMKKRTKRITVHTSWNSSRQKLQHSPSWTRLAFRRRRARRVLKYHLQWFYPILYGDGDVISPSL